MERRVGKRGEGKRMGEERGRRSGMRERGRFAECG